MIMAKNAFRNGRSLGSRSGSPRIVPKSKWFKGRSNAYSKNKTRDDDVVNQMVFLDGGQFNYLDGDRRTYLG